MSSIAGNPAASAASALGNYEDLTALFSEWRAFERPARLERGDRFDGPGWGQPRRRRPRR